MFLGVCGAKEFIFGVIFSHGAVMTSQEATGGPLGVLTPL